MSWIPPNLSETCAVYTTITTCQPPAFLFLQLVASLFGASQDAPDDRGGVGELAAYPESHEYLDFFDEGGFGDGDIKQQEEQQLQQEYDFIVVGAGSAGCVVANRLTENKEWRVLLLEAGDEEPEVAGVPAFPPLLQRSSIDWGFATQPQSHSCLARRNGQCNWARGKVMGGSSTVNYMIYIRGNTRDYDEWAEMGNHGWSFQDVLPYFIKSEDNHDLDKIDPYYHGVGGYLSVEQMPYQDENVLRLLEAYEQAGLPIFDQNAGHQVGASLLQTTTKDGVRMSANRAFIRPIRGTRKNLVVETGAQASRVLINPHTKTAFGVEYERNGKIVQALARKEVIVSCGSILSPKLLMLSGIGPADHLQQHGIQVIQDLKVGYNLQDHTTIDGVVFVLTNKTATTATLDQQRQDVYYYKDNHRGPLSSTGTLQLNAFVQTKYEEEVDRADIQYSIDAANVQNLLADPILTAETNVNPLAYYDGLMIRPILLNPKSRGVIKLNDTDPVYGAPLIYANTFYEEIDLLRMIEGIKQSLTLLNTPALRKIGVQLLTSPMPNCQHFEFGTDDYWACLAMQYTTTIFHFAGTCKMGPRSDGDAVVDPELRVNGIKNLRVIDSSIIPKIVRGNTNAPTIMIAEKGSDYIKGAWRRKESSELFGGHFFSEI